MRRVVALVRAAVLAATLTTVAWAGSYLDRASFLVRQARYEMDYLEYRLGNRELAELVHKMAVARAAEAAETGAPQRFTVYRSRARDEEQIFRSIMRQMNFPLEDEKKK
jgi:hypothetical protein